jgi:two-component system, OmpR family, sensor histidine kinase KdpD
MQEFTRQVSAAPSPSSESRTANLWHRSFHLLGRHALAAWVISPPPGRVPRWGEAPASRPLSYLEALGLIAFVTLIGFPIADHVAAPNLSMLYLLAVLIAALRWGRGPAVSAALIGTVAFDFYFIPPYRSFAITDLWYLITCAGMLTVGLIVSTLAAEAREQTETAHANEQYIRAAYAFALDMADTSTKEEIIEVVCRHLTDTLCYPVFLALPEAEGLAPRFRSPEFDYDSNEKSAAEWAFYNGQPAGRWTAHFPGVHGYYLPLKSHGVLGVLGIRTPNSGASLSSKQSALFETFATRASLALRRVMLEQKAREAQLLEETHKLQRALLNSISHNLRTPLATVTGTLKSLLEDSAVLNESTRRELLSNAEEQAVRLNRLVGNLLDMTRLEAGAVLVRPEPCDLQDIIGAALGQLGEQARRRTILVELPRRPLLVPLDFVLITQVLVNLVDNALKYSCFDQPVVIAVQEAGEWLEVRVADRGEGIPEQYLERVFDRFHRGGRTDTGGAGLGLSICRGFVEAHGGCIWAERAREGGTAVTFAIPQRPGGQRGPRSRK